MEVWNSMLALAEVHLYNDSVEPSNDWHRRLHLQYITEVWLNAIDQDLDNPAIRSYTASNAAFFCRPAALWGNTSGNAPRMWVNSLLRRVLSLVMCPHTDHLDHALCFVYLVDKAELDVDAPGIGACQIPYQFFERGRCLKWICGKDGKQLLSLWTQARS